MQFHEKVDLVLNALNIKNVTLAQVMGIDATLVSKFRTGKRKRPSKQQQIEALCAAIVQICPDAQTSLELPAEIRAVFQANNSAQMTLEDALLIWFEDDDPSENNNGFAPAAPRVFGEKLSALLEISGVSNAQIARALNVDSSLISLYRNGLRVPTARSVTIDAISSFFARQTLTHQQRLTLCEIIEFDESASDAPSLQSALSSWLSAVSGESAEIDSVESFLERVDNFGSFAAGKSVIPLEEIAQKAGDGTKPAVLFGHQGIQQAAVTYLTHVALQDEPQTLHHFSDQSTEWMLGDSEYASVWASLMVHVLSKGHTLRIIHTVNRDSSELFSAMENWIPLYMIGEIVPYYFRSGTSGRFRTSHFLAENLALISGHCPAGLEDQAVYYYDVDPRIITLAKEQFEELLSQCGELMRVYKGKRDEDSYRIHLNAFWGRKGDAMSLTSRLSLATLPRQLLESKLEYMKLDAHTTSAILESQAKQEKVFMRQLDNGGLDEVCVVEPDETVCAGSVFFDLPPGLITEPVPYTLEEYQAHLSHIRQLEAQHEGYRFTPLPMSPFHNIKIHCKKDGRSIVEKLSEPTVAFSFNNPHMCRGITHFLTELKKRAEQ